MIAFDSLVWFGTLSFPLMLYINIVENPEPVNVVEVVCISFSVKDSPPKSASNGLNPALSLILNWEWDVWKIQLIFSCSYIPDVSFIIHVRLFQYSKGFKLKCIAFDGPRCA